MIQKLRRQFILVAMCSTLAVLVVIIGTLNILNYTGTVQKKDEILALLSDNNGRFPAFFNMEKQPRERDNAFPEKQMQDASFGKNRKGFMPWEGFTREMPYETRFFSVTLNSNGEVTKTDGAMIASIDEETAKTYAQTIYKKLNNKQSLNGFYDEYRYRITKTDDGYFVLFVDSATDLANFRKVLVTSIGASALGLLAVFLLVLFFSKKVFKPVEQSYRKQKQFVTDASHELKTPLTIISANLEVMEMESEESQWSKSIKKQLERMIGLVEQMVTLSRLDEQKEVAKEKFSLSDALIDTAQAYLPVAEQSGKEFVIDVAENVSMTGDEKQIRQMTGLLLDNAMKYASIKSPAEEGAEASKAGKPKIRLSLCQKGKKAEIVLWNTVDQIDVGNKEELFERFYRPDRSRNSKTGGSGIGLSIVRSIVEAHHGKITAVSKDGASIEFKATLPLG
ncbi:MAG: HAMP domain-containing histidine kinase [Lachnospiraceae bacterium]|nr:HAMP domain-containing histidine kinase [Lachnospiraceae bacterium]